MKLYLKGERCYTDKCAIERRNYAPGQHGQGRRRKISEYALQLREKQRLKRMYGLLERQFHRYFEMAERSRIVTGEALLQLLERRLDNIVYRMGLARSRAEARQLVGHRHFMVNGKPVDVPSLSDERRRRDHGARRQSDEGAVQARDRSRANGAAWRPGSPSTPRRSRAK